MFNIFPYADVQKSGPVLSQREIRERMPGFGFDRRGHYRKTKRVSLDRSFALEAAPWHGL